MNAHEAAHDHEAVPNGATMFFAFCKVASYFEVLQSTSLELRYGHGNMIVPNPRFLGAHSSGRPRRRAAAEFPSGLARISSCCLVLALGKACPCGCGGRTLSGLGKTRGHCPLGRAEGPMGGDARIRRCPARCRGSTRLTAASFFFLRTLISLGFQKQF